MKAISLYEFQRNIKLAVEKGVDSYWIVAEVSDIKVNSSGHCYLELVEKSDNSSAIPKAKANAVIWRSTFMLLRPYFYEETGRHIEKGMRIMIYATASFHELYGMSIVIKDIDPTYTLGDWEQMKLRTIEQLKDDGVFDMNRELDFPIVAERIAIISSETAAGYQDFINHLKGNDYGYTFTTTLFPSLVQGENAENAIISALMHIDSRYDKFDCVVILRGGGSQSDMACFNGYNLCNYIAQFSLPIITAIGHDKDVSVADMISHQSVKTPTAAAHLLIDKKHSFDLMLDGALNSIIEKSNETIEKENRYLLSISNDLNIFVKESVHVQSLRINNFISEIRLLTSNYLHSARNNINNYDVEIKRGCDKQLQIKKDELYQANRQIMQLSQNHIKDKNHMLDIYEAKIGAYNPKRILELGFSMTLCNGKAIKSVSNLSKNDIITTKFFDGTVTSKIENID